MAFVLSGPVVRSLVVRGLPSFPFRVFRVFRGLPGVAALISAFCFLLSAFLCQLSAFQLPILHSAFFILPSPLPSSVFRPLSSVVP